MKILVWLSWWVDSAVSALLLKQQWHEVVGGFMINYKEPNNPNCTTKQDFLAAKDVANFLWIKLLKFDFSDIYEQKILNYMYENYKNWYTPNPDVFCNNLIKFDVFLKKAIELWFDKIATWHYAQIKNTTIYKKIYGSDIFTKKNKFLYEWIDKNKDQSYFLSWLNQFQLSKSIFPIWEYTKQEIRKIASQNKLPNANRPDSQWLCFIWKVSIKDFLWQKLWYKKWKIMTLDWTIVWEHDWAWFWTIGQKRWLNINRPAYVVKIDVKQNIVYVSFDKNCPLLYRDYVECKNFHWINWIEYAKKILTDKNSRSDIFCKLRYRQNKVQATFEIEENWLVKIKLNQKIYWVANWQIAVLYFQNQVLWNGIIN